MTGYRKRWKLTLDGNKQRDSANIEKHSSNQIEEL